MPDDFNQDDLASSEMDPSLKILLALQAAKQGPPPQVQTPGQGAFAPPLNPQMTTAQAPQQAQPLPRVQPSADDTEMGPSGKIAKFINDTSFINPKTAETKPDEDMGGLLNNAIKGFIIRASQYGEMPKPETFDQYWKRTSSPGREFLANMMFGAASGLTGDKFRSARAQKFEEFQKEQERIQNENVQNENLLTHRAQLLGTLLNARNQMQEKKYEADIKDANADEDRKMKLAADAVKNTFLSRKLTDEENKQKAIEARWDSDGTDKFYKQGLSMAKSEAQAQGKDLNNPAVQNEIKKRATQLGNAVFNEREKIENANRPVKAPPRDRLEVKEFQVGNSKDVMILNKDTGQWVSRSPWMQPGLSQVSLSPEMNARIIKFDQIKDTLESAIREIATHPNDVGSFVRMLPPELQPYINRSARNLSALWPSVLNSIAYAYSGAQINENEAKRLQAGYPRMFESPERFLPAALMQLNLLHANSLRARTGIDPNELGLGDVYQMQEEKVYQDLKNKKTPVILSSNDLLDLAAKMKHKKVIRDMTGQPRKIVNEGEE